MEGREEKKRGEERREEGREFVRCPRKRKSNVGAYAQAFPSTRTLRLGGNCDDFAQWTRPLLALAVI